MLSFLKVLSVVKEQVGRALEIQPATFEQFRNKLQHLTYAEITNIWQQERRHKEEFESQARPIVYVFTHFLSVVHMSVDLHLNFQNFTWNTILLKYTQGKEKG